MTKRKEKRRFRNFEKYMIDLIPKFKKDENGILPREYWFKFNRDDIINTIPTFELNENKIALYYSEQEEQLTIFIEPLNQNIHIHTIKIHEQYKYQFRYLASNPIIINESNITKKLFYFCADKLKYVTIEDLVLNSIKKLEFKLINEKYNVSETL